MIPDLDIYRSAQVLVKRHGEDAPIEAAMRADAMLDKGDLYGYAVWKRIVKATEDKLPPWYSETGQRAPCKRGNQVHFASSCGTLNLIKPSGHGKYP